MPNDRSVAGCTGKSPFPSPTVALRVLRRYQARYRRHKLVSSRRRLVVYRCRSCGRWHLGGTEFEN